MTISCIQCGKSFDPKKRRDVKNWWQVTACSKKCSAARKKARHASPEYAQKNAAGRALRRLADPSAEYQSLRRRRPWKAAHNAKRSNAKRKNVEFTLTEAWYERNYKAGCAVTGIAFRIGEGVISPYSPTVDRINPNKGYIPRNCRMVLHAVNALRGSGSDEDMYKIAKAITKRRTT